MHNSMVMEQLKDEEGRPTDFKRRYEVHQYTMFNIQVQGFPLKGYSTKNNTKEKLIRWTFDCVESLNQECAVAEQRAAMKKAANMYPAANFDFGAASWTWPELAICNQKIVQQEKFDPNLGYSRGAHMPHHGFHW